VSAELIDPTEYQPDEDGTNLLDETEPPATPEEEEQYSPETAHAVLAWDVGEVVTAADDLNRTASVMSVTSWEDAAGLLARLRGARQLLQVVENGFERHIAESRKAAGFRMNDPTEVPGVGVVLHRKTSNRKDWDHEALAKEVIGHWIDEHGGEIPDGFETRDLLMTHAHFDYWRVTGLKKLGIDVGEYCTTIPGRLTVDIQAGDQ
jgi:hypothetical protein